MFKVRTEAVKEGTKPYAWSVESVYQCTWYSFFRCQEAMSCTPPTYWDRATQTGSYPNAKLWLENYRDPWQVKGVDYTPVAGDIAVFDGEYGHVQFMETDVMYSEYSNGDPNSFRNGRFEKKDNLLGFLHYPYESVNPVDRNTEVDQIQTTDDTLRIRTAPSLEAEIVGHVQIGYYNVIQSKDNDGYIWYEIAKNRWCANITTKFLPKDDNDFVKQLERFLNETKAKIKALEGENEELRADMSKISNITERWK